MKGSRRYSVKWYRDNEEFYRYMPKFDPPNHAYRMEGIKVDLLRLDDRRVSLQQVTLKSSGVYRCEVSAEAPSFASAGEGKMEVIFRNSSGRTEASLMFLIVIPFALLVNTFSERGFVVNYLETFIEKT